MTSSDREILIEISGRLVRMESRMDKLETRMEVIERRLDIIETRVEGLQTSVYWIFAGISVVIGISTMFLSVLPNLRREEKEKGATLSDMIALIKFGRDYDSSKPMNDTEGFPDKTASS